MYSFTTENGGFRIYKNGVLIIDQPFDPSKVGLCAFDDPSAAAESVIKTLLPPPLPELVCHLEGIGEGVTTKGHEATLRVGAGVRATFWLEVNGHKLSNFNGHFRLPVQPVDANDRFAGPAVLIKVEIKDGEGVAEFYPKSASTYIINNETITARLAPTEMMRFDGEIRIVCLEA